MYRHMKSGGHRSCLMANITTCCFFEADRLKQSGTLFKRKKKTFNEITYVLIDMFHQLLLLGTKKKPRKTIMNCI